MATRESSVSAVEYHCVIVLQDIESPSDGEARIRTALLQVHGATFVHFRVTETNHLQEMTTFIGLTPPGDWE